MNVNLPTKLGVRNVLKISSLHPRALGSRADSAERGLEPDCLKETKRRRAILKPVGRPPREPPSRLTVHDRQDPVHLQRRPPPMAPGEAQTAPCSSAGPSEADLPQLVGAVFFSPVRGLFLVINLQAQLARRGCMRW